MPNQAPLRMIKEWQQLRPRKELKNIRVKTRGVYVLYQEQTPGELRLIYIGVAGLGEKGKSGAKGRLERHAAGKMKWTHFSLFEVHDNVTSDEIREIEALLLVILRKDSRISLENKQTSTRRLNKVLTRN